jgi:hypothetical protein
MNLRSGLYKRYKKAFILDEDALRRIHGVLKKAAKDVDGPPEVVFHVERDDDRYYESTNVEDILADPNVWGKRVRMTGIGLRRPATDPKKPWFEDDDFVHIAFHTAETEHLFPEYNRVSIRISTDDRDWALLLADELQPQVERTFKAKASPRWLLILFLLPFLLAIGKLTFLNVGFKPKDIGLFLYLLITFGFLFYMFRRMSGPPQWFIRLFGPESAFLWGEESQSYPDREQTRRNVLWTVVVAFLVTFAGSIVFTLSGISGP